MPATIVERRRRAHTAAAPAGALARIILRDTARRTMIAAFSPTPEGLVLLPGERVRWSGRPARGIRVSGQDLYLVPFSLLWGGFALFWNVNAWSMGAPWFFRLWGLPFLVAGAYVVAGRFAHDAWLRARTRYAVTDRRLVILRGRTARSLDLDRLPLADMHERADGSGTLIFGDAPSPFSFQRQNWGLWTPMAANVPQFRDIADVRQVYALIARTTG